MKALNGVPVILRRSMRKQLKAAGFKRPMAILKARRQISGMVGRGNWWSVMLDFNRDFYDSQRPDKVLNDCLDWYGKHLQKAVEYKQENTRPLRKRTLL